MAPLDQTLMFAAKGYAWLPDLRRRAHGQPVAFRFRGRPAVAVAGPDAARFFYADGNLERQVGEAGTVGSLAGEPHRHRKALFVSLLMGDTELPDLVNEEFDRAVQRWQGGPAVSLLDEAAVFLTSAVTRWTGVPNDRRLAEDLIARSIPARRRRDAWMAEIIEDVRAKKRTKSPLSTFAHEIEDPRVAAAEMLNVLRPAAAIARLVAFAGHALDRWPEHRDPLREDRPGYAKAFADEIRRFYPTTPFLRGRAARDLAFGRQKIPAGTLVLLDVFGQHHDERFWPEPYAFRPARFVNRPAGEYELIPQGAGDPLTGHRCPGEPITADLLGLLAQKLARLNYYLPPQNSDIDLSRVPARPRDGLKLVAVTPSRSLANDRR